MPGGGFSPEYDFDETKPAGSTKLYDGDNWMRSNQQHFDNAMAAEHYSPTNDPDASEDDFGRHDFITLKKQSTKPDLSGSSERYAVYLKADGVYVETTGGAEVLLVSSGGAIGNLPTGTVCLFGQATSPTGWTKKTDWQDGAAITINSDADGTALGSGGAGKLEEASGTQDHALTVAEMPTHNHSYSTPSCSGGSTAMQCAAANSYTTGTTGNAGSGDAHSHDLLVSYYQ